MPSGKRQKNCRGCPGGKAHKRPTPKFKRPLAGKRFIITCAQNNTPVHEAGFGALSLMAATLDAALVVVPLRYKNPTSLAENSKADQELWWDVPEKYLFNQRKRLHPHLLLAADIKTQPTAVDPLSGLEGVGGGSSLIVAHPKMRLISAATGDYPKLMTTTGAITEENYSDTRAGKVGEFHHYLGAIVVELDGDFFHLRQLNVDRRDGSFIDLDVLWTVDGPQPAPPALGLVLGDVHVAMLDQGVEETRFGPGGIVETLNPQHLVAHDTFDGYACNPHHEGNPFIAVGKVRSGRGGVKAEVALTLDWIKKHARPDRQVVVVPSNHDDFLRRWVLSADWKRMPGEDGEFYLSLATLMREGVRYGPGGTEYPDPFVMLVNDMGRLLPVNARALRRDEPFKLADIDVKDHGDRGPNGAKGTMKNLARTGTKRVTGHRHQPEIFEGHYGVGTGTPLKLEYTSGPSSWLNTDCVIYANGRRSLISIIGGRRWRLV